MLKWLVRLFIVMMLGAVLGVASLIGIYFYIKPQLPDVSALRDVKLFESFASRFTLVKCPSFHLL